MDLEGFNDTTTSFFTLDACDGELATQIMAVLSLNDDEIINSWKKLLSDFPKMETRLRTQGIQTPDIRKSINWDDAMILFTCSLEINNQQRPIQLGEQLSKERFGRFPWGDGSATKYLIQFLRPNSTLKSSKEINKLIIDQINIFRKEYGTLDHPNYQFQVMGEAAYSPDGIKNLEDLGATEVIVAFRNAYEGGKDERTLEGMIAEINWYAEEVINKSK